MGAAPDRLTRVNELIKREVSDLIYRNSISPSASVLVSVTEVRTSVDLRNATVSVSVFGGGKADIVLDESQDVLECGIEIQVQPPGKKLQKLSLLSGGEKALTAIAILFSILRLRPMPFCVLDEIEAALDDANLGKLLYAIEQLRQTTQLIVISHQRRTMEQADVLYGVTMQEEGVSKLLELTLAEVENIDK